MADGRRLLHDPRRDRDRERAGEERATLGPGNLFGELALIDKASDRTATVVATTELRCACMTAWEFRPFVLEHPDVSWHLLETLAERLRLSEERATADRAVTSAAACGARRRAG